MAGEVQLSYQAGATVYCLIRNRLGQVWNTASAAFEAYNSSSYADYDVAMVEQGTVSGFYVGTFPAAISAGVYGIVAKRQAGGSPAETDVTVGTGDLQWNGSVTLPLSDLATSGQVGQFAPLRVARGVAISGFLLYLRSASDHVTPFLSGVVSGQISRDGGGFGALQSGAFTEIGQGFYKVNLTSGDLAGTSVGLLFTAAGISGGQSDPLPMALLTQRTSGYN